jgi:hypothetical protein
MYIYFIATTLRPGGGGGMQRKPELTDNLTKVQLTTK